jgi:hypothetical protein
LREEHGLRVFENTVLRRIFGPKKDELTGEWRKIHNEELNDLYCSPVTFMICKHSTSTSLLFQLMHTLYTLKH